MKLLLIILLIPILFISGCISEKPDIEIEEIEDVTLTPEPETTTTTWGGSGIPPAAAAPEDEWEGPPDEEWVGPLEPDFWIPEGWKIDPTGQPYWEYEPYSPDAVTSCFMNFDLLETACEDRCAAFDMFILFLETEEAPDGSPCIRLLKCSYPLDEPIVTESGVNVFVDWGYRGYCFLREELAWNYMNSFCFDEFVWDVNYFIAPDGSYCVRDFWCVPPEPEPDEFFDWLPVHVDSLDPIEIEIPPHALGVEFFFDFPLCSSEHFPPGDYFAMEEFCTVTICDRMIMGTPLMLFDYKIHLDPVDSKWCIASTQCSFDFMP